MTKILGSSLAVEVGSSGRIGVIVVYVQIAGKTYIIIDVELHFSIDYRDP